MKSNRNWTLAIIGIASIVPACFLLYRESVDEQLAEIEAARAIPDSENAAIIYNELLAEYGDIRSPPDFLDHNASDMTISHPWSSITHPKLAEWIEGLDPMMGRLVEAAKMDRCHFTIHKQDGQIDRLMARLMWEDVLTRAANRDVGEGRSDKAIEKYMVMIQFGRHLGQQPTFLENGAGIGLEERSIHALIRFIVYRPLSNDQLHAIEQYPIDAKNDWAAASEAMLRMERLRFKVQHSGWERLKELATGSILKQSLEAHRIAYLNTVSNRRALKIIIGLARYRNAHGSWAESLAQIKPLASDEVLIDPLNGSPFVYRLCDKSFMLYSKGENGIDEDGRYSSTMDPNSHKVIVEEDDRQFWPATAPEAAERITQGNK